MALGPVNSVDRGQFESRHDEAAGFFDVLLIGSRSHTNRYGARRGLAQWEVIPAAKPIQKPLNLSAQKPEIAKAESDAPVETQPRNWTGASRFSRGWEKVV
ncbi:MAG TPA: hypothetical protein VMF06_05555 [Candidatus Limnocylindria bacterium]|jgi:hypothetical protein|nr:hypothetical protein [Candidatus Limnocylindria bacterium]